MDDLIPFLVFIVIALINLVKFLLERKFQGKKPANGNEPPEEKPASGLENFFEDLARKLDPNEKPVDLPDWPEGYEKPDYSAEQAAYEEYQQEERIEEDVFKPAPKAEIISMPITPVAEIRPRAPVAAVETAALKSAMKAIPALRSTFSSGIKSAPILRSGHSGAIDFPLQKKSDLRKAILAKVVLDPPRAFDASFDNTSRR